MTPRVVDVAPAAEDPAGWEVLGIGHLSGGAFLFSLFGWYHLEWPFIAKFTVVWLVLAGQMLLVVEAKLIAACTTLLALSIFLLITESGLNLDLAGFLAVAWACTVLGALRAARMRANPPSEDAARLLRLVEEKLDTVANRKARDKWTKRRFNRERNPDADAAWGGSKALTWILLPFSFLYLGGPLGALRHWARQMQLRHALVPADDLILRDPRPPVLYLRSFRDDDLSTGKIVGEHRLESLIVDVFSLAGPVIAVGEPSESLPPLGAARSYFGENWKAEVSRYITRAQMVVVIVAASEGLRWELRELAAQGALRRTVFVVPPLPPGELPNRWAGFVETIWRFPDTAPTRMVNPEKVLTFFVEDDGGLTLLAASRRISKRYDVALKLSAAARLRGVADETLRVV